MIDLFNYRRREASPVQVGDIQLGGDAPIRVQSMTTTKTTDINGTLQQIAALDNNASKLVGDILSEYIKGDMEYFGIPGGPVHDATVIAYLLKPELFSGRQVNLVIDNREGVTHGQTIPDWYDTLAQNKNVFWVENGDAQGFFDLLTQRLALLK